LLRSNSEKLGRRPFPTTFPYTYGMMLACLIINISTIGHMSSWRSIPDAAPDAISGG
jgi:hypothetical protein